MRFKVFWFGLRGSKLGSRQSSRSAGRAAMSCKTVGYCGVSVQAVHVEHSNYLQSPLDLFFCLHDLLIIRFLPVGQRYASQNHRHLAPPNVCMSAFQSVCPSEFLKDLRTKCTLYSGTRGRGRDLCFSPRPKPGLQDPNPKP